MKTETQMTFLVDVHWDVAKTYEVKAEDPAEAERIMRERMERGELSYFDDGYESTDDTDVQAVGITRDDGSRIFFQ